MEERNVIIGGLRYNLRNCCIHNGEIIITHKGLMKIVNEIPTVDLVCDVLDPRRDYIDSQKKRIETIETKLGNNYSEKLHKTHDFFTKRLNKKIIEYNELLHEISNN